MKQSKYFNWWNLIFSLAGVLLLTSCEKFVKGESENLAPFSKQTINLIGSLEYDLNNVEIIYLRKVEDYFEKEDAYARYLALENQIGNMLTALVAYSLQIVNISEQGISENDKANKLADVVLALRGIVLKDQVIVNENFDQKKHDETIRKVRASQDYLEALRLLLPTINEFSAHAGRVLDELQKEKQSVASLIDRAIDRKYGATLDFYRELRMVKDDVYHTLINLSQYGLTNDAQYLEKMKSYGLYQVDAATRGKKSLTLAEQAKLHEDLTSLLDTVNRNYEQVLPDITEYYASHRELNQLVESKEDGIREARLTFVVWSRAYQKMANGKTDPAEWFDISESGALLFGAAKRAAGI